MAASLTTRLLLGLLAAWVLGSPPASALIFADPSLEPAEPRPIDFPYWDHVTQRDYDGPTTIYLGAGWVMTARHVGHGEIRLGGQVVPIVRRTPHTLLNFDGSIADAVVFELDPNADLPELPLLPITTRAPEVGEEVLMIGFGRTAKERIEWGEPGSERTAFTWSARGEKRWGTNRVRSIGQWVRHERFRTQSMVLDFSAPESDSVTPHEAAATLGDSGGAIFVHRDPEGWQLAGLITSISGAVDRPSNAASIGDVTFAVDLSQYRSEILRWARPQCANELDDDGDGKIDYPEDIQCANRMENDERRGSHAADIPVWKLWVLAAATIATAGLLWRSRRTLNEDEAAPIR